MTTTKTTTKTTKCIPLSTSWVFYFEEKGTTLLKPPPTLAKSGRNPLSNSLPSLLNPSCVLGKFDSVQGFWSYWNNINLSTLPPCSQIKLFKSTVLPQPDALTNTNGGKWVIACDRSQNISQFWLLCLLALIGEQFQDDYIVGSVLSVGARNTISIWTREHHRKCMESTEKDLCRLLNISREKMRFQKHNKEAKPVKCFKIKVSRSVDLTHSPESPSSSPNNPASYSPNISPSPSDDDLTVFIDLKTGTTQKGTKFQPQRITTHTPRPHKSPQVLPTARMAVSIDSANFQKWRGNEYLPKLHRRRGRRSSWHKLPIISYSQTQISQNIIPENNDKPININVVSADEKDISAVLLQSTTTKKKSPLNNITHTLEKTQLVNSSGFLGGWSYLAWISIFLGMTTVLLGTYVTLFLPAGI